MNPNYMNSCGCDNVSPVVTMPCKQPKSLAMAYVPWQSWQNVMDGCAGLKHGTIFEELVMPFEGVKAACGGNCPCNEANNNYHRRVVR